MRPTDCGWAPGKEGHNIPALPKAWYLLHPDKVSCEILLINASDTLAFLQDARTEILAFLGVAPQPDHKVPSEARAITIDDLLPAFNATLLIATVQSLNTPSFASFK